eukprot:1184458-Prorocentrum_minimum.AAC.8
MVALNVHTIALNVHTIALNVHTITRWSSSWTTARWTTRLTLNVHAIALNVHTVALNVHTVALNVHIFALNVHTIALNVSTLTPLTSTLLPLTSTLSPLTCPHYRQVNNPFDILLLGSNPDNPAAMRFAVTADAYDVVQNLESEDLERMGKLTVLVPEGLKASRNSDDKHA